MPDNLHYFGRNDCKGDKSIAKSKAAHMVISHCDYSVLVFDSHYWPIRGKR